MMMDSIFFTEQLGLTCPDEHRHCGNPKSFVKLKHLNVVRALRTGLGLGCNQAGAAFCYFVGVCFLTNTCAETHKTLFGVLLFPFYCVSQIYVLTGLPLSNFLCVGAQSPMSWHK
jgi:hypothetical protein